MCSSLGTVYFYCIVQSSADILGQTKISGGKQGYFTGNVLE